MNQGITGIYLAAGESRRMGFEKLSLPLGKTTLGSMALQAALRSKLDQILVISRKDQPLNWIDSSLKTPTVKGKWRCFSCDEAFLGQAHSLGCGLKAAQALGAAGVVIMLADQPLITAQMIDQLILCFRDSANQGLDYIAASYNGLPLPPILFSASTFPQLLKLKGDEGARRLLRGDYSLTGVCIEFNDPKLFLDVDTVEAYWQVTFM